MALCSREPGLSGRQLASAHLRGIGGERELHGGRSGTRCREDPTLTDMAGTLESSGGALQL